MHHKDVKRGRRRALRQKVTAGVATTALAVGGTIELAKVVTHRQKAVDTAQERQFQPMQEQISQAVDQSMRHEIQAQTSLDRGTDTPLPLKPDGQVTEVNIPQPSAAKKPSPARAYRSGGVGPR